MQQSDIPRKDVDVLLIGYDIRPDGTPMLTVGKKRSKQGVEVINIFTGDEAKELYEKLITYKER